MKRKIVALCMFISLVSGIIFFANANADTPMLYPVEEPVLYNAETIYEHLQPAVFYIRVLQGNVQGDDSVKATGSGVAISPDGMAVTAYHVVKEAGRIEGTFPDGSVVSPIAVIGYDELTDVAILQLPDFSSNALGQKTYETIPIRKAAVRHGEKVFAIGYPLKNTPIITEGIINAPKVEINGRDRILTSAQIANGMSGGPIIDEHGELAGIISGSLRTMNNIHLVIAIDDLYSVLEASSLREK